MFLKHQDGKWYRYISGRWFMPMPRMDRDLTEADYQMYTVEDEQGNQHEIAGNYFIGQRECETFEETLIPSEDFYKS